MTQVYSPMEAKVSRMVANIGDAVKKDETVAILEAMKMEINVTSPADGEVKEIMVKPGDVVNSSTVIMTLE